MTDSIWDEDPSESTTSDIVVAQERNPDDEVASLIQNDANGNEVVTEINFSSPELDEQSARAITESIKTTANMMYLLVKRAHAGKAYKALGYTSFKEYVETEFGFSKVYAYRLLNQASFIEAIEAKVPEGTEIHISEPVSTKLKKALPELLETIEARVATLDDDDDAGAVIEDIIREHREQSEANNFLNDENDDELVAPAPTGTGGTWQGEDDEEDINFEEEDDFDEDVMDNSNDVRRKFDKIYNLYSGLKNINAVGSGEELVAFLPRERWDEFKDLLNTVTPWLGEFKEQFDAFLEEQETAGTDAASDDSDDDEEDDTEDEVFADEEEELL
jgi:hypothetical protein